MRARTKRLWLILAAGGVLVSAASIALVALDQTMTYFYTPKDIAEKGGVPPGQRAKLGGLVAPGTLVYRDDGSVVFQVVDEVGEIEVRYAGIVPDLFREGQGMIAEGAFNVDGSFEAERVLAKHDENYVPRELADTLKDRGEWRAEGT